CRGEEVAAVGVAPNVRGADEPQVRLVDQGGRIERLPGLFAGQLLRGEAAQLVVDERQQFVRGKAIAGGERVQEMIDVCHERAVYGHSKGVAREFSLQKQDTVVTARDGAEALPRTTPGRSRTYINPLRRRVHYPLCYGGLQPSVYRLFLS